MPTVHARTVRRAAEIVGGIGRLAQHLEVQNESFIEKWQDCELAVPQEIFLKCVDIVNAHQLYEISGLYGKDPAPKDAA